MSDIHHLYGAPCSLFTGKARSYLRKKGAPFQERLPIHPDFMNALGQTGVMRLPILMTPKGEAILDTSVIIDRLEPDFPRLPAIPKSPRRRIAAKLFELVGDEYLVRPALHYRWSHPENAAYVAGEFGRVQNPKASAEEAMALGEPLVAKYAGYLAPLGVTEETRPAFEEAYKDFVAAFDAHLADWPYVLGDAPTLADYGLMGPLFAHLGRDPYSYRTLAEGAPRVLRWVEWMNAPEPLPPEFADREAKEPEGDDIPETALALLKIAMTDFMPELLSLRERFSVWLVDTGYPKAGTKISDKQDQPDIGPISFTLRGRKVNARGRGYTLWMLQRILDDVAGLDDPAPAHKLLSEVGASALKSFDMPRRLDRRNNFLCLG